MTFNKLNHVTLIPIVSLCNILRPILKVKLSPA